MKISKCVPSKGLIVNMGCGFISGGQESSFVFGAVEYKYRQGSATLSTLPLVLIGKRSCFSQGERSTVQLPLGPAFALWN